MSDAAIQSVISLVPIHVDLIVPRTMSITNTTKRKMIR